MAYAWSWFGLANLVASGALLVLAVLFLRARRSEFTLAFAAYAVLTATQKFSGGMWLYFSADDPTRAFWARNAAVILLLLIPTLVHALLAFVGGPRWARVPRAAKAVLYAPALLVGPLLVFDAAAFEQASFTLGMVFTVLLLLFLWPVARKHRTARTQVERIQSKYMLVYLVIALSFSAEARAIPFLIQGARVPWWELSLAYLVATCFLLYGILKHHLFAIDLFAKRATYYTLITAASAAAFLVLEQVVQQLIDLPGYESLLAAVGAALLIAPLAHLARRPVDRLFPDVHSSADYFAKRKLEVYRAQLELALADGFITRSEHEFLERSRRELGITEQEHDTLEREVRAAMRPAKPGTLKAPRSAAAP